LTTYNLQQIPIKFEEDTLTFRKAYTAGILFTGVIFFYKGISSRRKKFRPATNCGQIPWSVVRVHRKNRNAQPIYKQ
ncbi:MAG: hypothetical protein QME81_06295, partial [bacterium]|nr:hypothetical protein [bacterium]